MPYHDLLGTEFEIDPQAVAGLASGDPVAIKGLIVTSLNFVPGVGSILSAVASILPWEVRGPTQHPTEAQKVEVANQVVNGYIAQTRAANINWLAVVNGKPLYKAVVDQIQDVVWPDGIRRWGGGWVRNQSPGGAKYYDRGDLAPHIQRGTQEFAEYIVDYALKQMVLNLVGELDVATISTQGRDDIAYYMSLSTKPLTDALAQGISVQESVSLDTVTAFFSSPLGLGLLAGLLVVGGFLVLKRMRD